MAYLLENILSIDIPNGSKLVFPVCVVRPSVLPTDGFPVLSRKG